eukprot:10961778-Ditylum_brightwellii.AAC.1
MEVERLHKAITPRILPKLGYQQTFQYAIVFGKKFSGGIGLMHVTATQLGAKVCGAVKHV